MVTRPGPRWPRYATAVAGLGVAAAFALPFAYLLVRAGEDWGAVWRALTSWRTVEPLWRSVQLTVLVSAGATALGVALAWLTVRTDLPGRTVWRVTAVLPLVIPSFVGRRGVAADVRAGWAPRRLVRDRLVPGDARPAWRHHRADPADLPVRVPAGGGPARQPPTVARGERPHPGPLAELRVLAPRAPAVCERDRRRHAVRRPVHRQRVRLGPDPRLRHAHPPAVRQPATPAGRGDRDGPAARRARARHHDRRAGGGAADPAFGRDRRPPGAARAARTVAPAGARGRDRSDAGRARRPDHRVRVVGLARHLDGRAPQRQHRPRRAGTVERPGGHRRRGRGRRRRPAARDAHHAPAQPHGGRRRRSRRRRVRPARPRDRVRRRARRPRHGPLPDVPRADRRLRAALRWAVTPGRAERGGRGPERASARRRACSGRRGGAGWAGWSSP